MATVPSRVLFWQTLAISESPCGVVTAGAVVCMSCDTCRFSHLITLPVRLSVTSCRLARRQKGFAALSSRLLLASCCHTKACTEDGKDCTRLLSGACLKITAFHGQTAMPAIRCCSHGTCTRAALHMSWPVGNASHQVLFKQYHDRAAYTRHGQLATAVSQCCSSSTVTEQQTHVVAGRDCYL